MIIPVVSRSERRSWRARAGRRRAAVVDGDFPAAWAPAAWLRCVKHGDSCAQERLGRQGRDGRARAPGEFAASGADRDQGSRRATGAGRAGSATRRAAAGRARDPGGRG